MKSIPIVEDDVFTALDLKSILKKIGVVENANDGLEALEKIKQKSYDLIITDDNMPRMCGEELYKELSALNKDLAKRIIFLSANLTDFMRSTGCTCLEKPFTDEQLIEAVKKLIR
ncbi:MAG TPA: response regulator [Thermodesulfobacteriota bacterium]|nr:response regulator [Thermodesulfobacteriota bacterium]